MKRYIRPKHLAFLTAIAFALPLFSADKYWTGAASTNANVAANWCDDAALSQVSTAAPQDGDDIHLTSGSVNMLWNINDIEVNSWEQDGYNGMVLFRTGLQNGVTDGLNHASKARVYGYTDSSGARILKVTEDVVLNTGTWTVHPQPSVGASSTAWKSGLCVYRLLVDAGGDVTIGANATVNLKGRGYCALQGPGAITANNSGCATHGGCGSSSKSSNSSCYGDVREPVTIGSSANKLGGGAVKIKCGGAFVLNGTINVSGNDDGPYHMGAGGSIYINAGSFSGSGMMNANGGTGTATSHDEGGGGGRISVILTGNGSTFAGWSGTMKAKLGKKNGSSGDAEGSGGTIYMETPADGVGHGVLKIDGSSDGFYLSTGVSLRTRLTSSTLGATRPRKFIFAKSAKASLEIDGYEIPEVEQEVDSSISGTGYLELISGVTAYVTQMPDAPLSLAGGSVLVVGQNGSGTLEVDNGQVLYARGTASVNGSVHIFSGGKLSHLSTSTKMNLTINGDLTVDSGGLITANGLGTATYGTTSKYGGSYGGRSRNSSAKCYGSVRCPVDYGSTGSGNSSSNGGGAIRITTTGNMTINGTVSANGATAAHRPGSGGSVWLTGRTLSGTGTISADGGNQSSASVDTAGGGGRIAVWLTGANADFTSFSGSFHAYGGYRTSSNAVKASAGTVYLKKGNEADNEGTLYIVNSTKVAETTDFMNGASTQHVDVPMKDFDVGEVIVDKSAVLVQGAEVQVTRGWNTKSGSTLTCNAGGNLRVTGSSDAYFYGSNAFYSFFCDVPGKTLYFGTGSGDLLSVQSGGSFSITGEAGNRLSLRPATAGETWKIKVPVSGLESFDVEQVSVEYSDASPTGGETIIARNSVESTPSTCVNWSFVTVQAGEDNTWTGANGTQWNDPLNWSLERTPASTDRVIVPVVENYPVLASDTEIAGLDVVSGAVFTLGGNNLSVTGSFVVNGTLSVSGTERVDISATNILLAANSLDAQRSVVTIKGDSDQTVSINVGLWRLNVEKGGGTVTWNSSTAVESVFSASASAAAGIAFAPSAAISCDEFVANGDVGGVASLTISGGAISAAKYARAKGVVVTGNNATGGVAVFVDSPSADGGNNPNWLFGTGRFVWTGSVDSVFTKGENWAGGVAPGENDVAEISSAASITITSPVAVGGLVLGGDANSVTFTARAALDIGDILYVGTNATLVLDAATTAGSVYVDDGGAITHTMGSTDETYKINLTVEGDMTVAGKGKVTAFGKGYTAGAGPASGVNLNYAASHGGRGSLNQSTPRLCYGSYISPVRYGSGGQSTAYGGGAIKLVVGGTLFAEGTIDADGNGNGTSIYTSSGGSVWITCADLKGRGSITANGGNGVRNSDDGYLGGGGRIAIHKTTAGDFSNWQGTATTYGGYYTRATNFTGTPQGSSGTVAWVLPGEQPCIVLENKNFVSSAAYGTDLPVSAERGGDAADVVKTYNIVARRGGKLNLLADATIYDLSLETANASVVLNGHTLTIRSRAHKNRRGWKGSVNTGDGGQIIWLPGGLSVTVR